MFCPGTSNLPDGRLLVSGGLSSAATSIYDPAANTWSTAAQMNIPRGYQANCVLEDGSVLTLGGSWSGGVGGKHGEVWNQAQGWRRLTGVPVTSMLSVDPGPENSYSQDSHFWLFPAGNGKVFYAGPGVNMQWIDTRGEGSVSAAGQRGDDVFSINGSAALYDIGKILKAGGAPSYDSVNAHASSLRDRHQRRRLGAQDRADGLFAGLSQQRRFAQRASDGDRRHDLRQDLFRQHRGAASRTVRPGLRDLHAAAADGGAAQLSQRGAAAARCTRALRRRRPLRRRVRGQPPRPADLQPALPVQRRRQRRSAARDRVGAGAGHAWHAHQRRHGQRGRGVFADPRCRRTRTRSTTISGASRWHSPRSAATTTS